ncbi:DNA segregation ATPase FtsK/SpoIIIE, S-DNA-T family [Streptoalloteichus tenebrarius]|uniref:DNA segregation ATPase FtsK/SpoIIIE, S-DNA-T family n=1 Tax=Streptoalloteichus tenebrarius (strain ATCC 17920 / DSM 40477 / JCM 4838 / CBS 697.72 / NBRC 16177 / NCIMB 11028 / NRRL B-12390 / A12253. 1 / ISP 5477) TaxID=1933 RepID=A0ABT1HXF8_STRSD|nr:type VII secretion protein EccCa [Streptoalloteichus tenebrarius]MCP2260208.1 DNA segregation ATPase FtsK/SpoIIIE, S-DNA-T family [Streptoalloteichus tenebrarius]BFF02590.1 type VII secretion protein EccC [Streptoalloteichus tenebrarius]
MSTLQFKRSPRLAAPRPPGGEVHLEPPPEVPRVIPGNIVMKLLPVVMVVASLGMMVFMFVAGGRNPMSLVFGGMMVISTLGMMAGGGQGAGQKKAEMNEDRKDYLRYLGQMRERAREAALEQRVEREWCHPDPQALWPLVGPGQRRMWERRPNDPDFCQVRICRGAQRLSTRLVPPQTGPVDELEPIATLALRRFVRAHSIVPDLPIAISLRGFAAVPLYGEKERTRALARAMLAQLATFHAPSDLLIAVVAAGEARREWEWVKWLPHAQHPRHVDGIGQMRLMAGSLSEVERMLHEELGERRNFSRNAQPLTDQPHIVILIDDGEVNRGEYIVQQDGLQGVTLIDLSDSLTTNLAQKKGLRIVLDGDRLGARTGGGIEWFGKADGLSAVEAESLARKLSPWRVATAQGGGAEPEDQPLLNSNVGLFELLGLGDPMTFDLAQAWRPRPNSEKYKVAFGVGEHGEPVELDIKETAMGGMGPHGLCVGATGSGKSEFLRTLVLAMMATHSSAALNLVLVDFKGGATFLGFDDAPHVSAVITNLGSDLTLVDRMRDALAGEMARRQQVLAESGKFKNVWDYEKARERGEDLPPMPALWIVIDEFSELLSAKPDFIELFVAIGRLGRSLQIHLLLASQRLEEGKLRGLDTHLSYRLGLKTFSAADSRAAIGIPDAADLPPIPGSGYLVFNNEKTRFKACYVSGPYRPPGMQAVQTAAPISGDRRPKFFVPDFIPIPEEPEKPREEPKPEKKKDDSAEPSELEIFVRRTVRQGPPARRVWLPPLEEPPTLDSLLPPLAPTEDRGLSAAGFQHNGRLAVPIGLEDRPYEQSQKVLWADLSGGAGHMAVVGRPQSGKSMLLRTLVMSMAVTHTPQEAQFYCIDFGGGALMSLRGLPHVGAVGGKLDPDLVRRTVAELSTLMVEREQRFRDLGIDSMTEFRNRKRRGEIKDDPYGDVFLLIDGWLAFKQDFEMLEQQIVNLANSGLSYGVHVVITANRWPEIRPALKDMLGSRFELRISDTSESDVDRKVAVNVPENRPGRGLSRDKLHFLVALPRVDSGERLSADMTPEQRWEVLVDRVGEGIHDAVQKINAAWRGPRAPQVRMLPAVLPYEQLPTPQQQPNPKLVPIGVNEDELAPVYLDFAQDPHFFGFAETEAGKSTLLRVVARGIVDRYTPQEARIILVDYRRSMLGFLPPDHVLTYAASSQQLQAVIGDVRTAMTRRLPGPDVTQEQLKNRSWWKGPDLFFIVDDYDLVAPSPHANPLAPLAEFLPQARDIGLHFVLMRNSGGASRAAFSDPIIGKLREGSAPGIVMSGNKDEGNLIGNVKPSPMPPGRGTLVARKGGNRLVQIAHIPPE